MAVFGLFFAAQSLLWGMGLASLPLIIHLLNRRRFKIVDWAAMQWLLEAIRKNRRRVRMEQWLLLALRTLLIALVVAAMAKPLLEGTSFVQAAVSTSATHHVLIFDNTLSMQFAAANQSRWEKAKGIAHAILDDARKGDVASLIAIGTPSVAIVADASPDLAAVGREIDALKPQHTAGRLDESLALVEQVLKQSRAATISVYVISDLQKSTWIGREKEGGVDRTKTANGDPRQEMGARLKKLSSRVGFVIVDLAEGEAGNLAVAAVESAEPLIVKNRPAVMRARIVNNSRQPQNSVKVELAVEGQVEKSETVNLSPGEETTVNFAHRFADAGEKTVEVRLPKDGLTQDNSRRIGVNVRDSLRTLLIDGQPSGEPFKSETDYLRIALSPQSDDATSLIRTEVRSETDLLELKLDDYDVVAICNVAQISPTEVNALDEYLKRGGSIVFFLGSQTNADAYNRLLFADGAGILPVRLGSVVGDPGKRDNPITFDPLGYRHPIIEAFRGVEQAGLITARIFRYVKLDLPEATKATVALGFNTKDAAIVVGPCRRGAVAVVATSCDLDWNVWPTSPSFVPIVQELVFNLSENRGHHVNLTAGEPIVVPVVGKGIDATAKVTTPDPAATAVSLSQDKAAESLVYTHTDLTGLYRVDVESPIQETWRFCVNAPIEESDLSKLTATDLRTMFPGFAFRMIDNWQGRTATAGIADSNRGELHRQLLYLALVCAFAETLFAWRFGHHR